MTNKPNPDAIQELYRNIAAVLAGQDPAVIGTILVAAVANWLRQYNQPNFNEAQLNALHIEILMRFLKGVAAEIGLNMECSPDDDDDLPTLGTA